MKAVILECRDGRAAVLCGDGTVRDVPDRGYTRGQTLDLALPAEDSDSAAAGRRLAGAWHRKRGLAGAFPAVAAAALAVAFMAGGVGAYAMPCSTVTMDVNPSVSYRLNIFDRVLSARAENEEGEAILEEIAAEVRGKGLPDAVMLTLDTLAEEEFIRDEDTSVVFSVDSRTGHQDRLEQKLMNGVSSWNEKKSGGGISASPTTVRVTDELREKAKKEHVTPGRSFLLEQVEQSLPEEEGFVLEEWIDRPIGELEEAVLAEPGRSGGKGAAPALPPAVQEGSSGPVQEGSSEPVQEGSSGAVQEGSAEPEKDGAPAAPGTEEGGKAPEQLPDRAEREGSLPAGAPPAGPLPQVQEGGTGAGPQRTSIGQPAGGQE